MARCVNHPDREAVENCVRCRKPLCKDCIRLGLDRLLYCPRCAPDEEEIGPGPPPWEEDKPDSPDPDDPDDPDPDDPDDPGDDIPFGF